MQPNGSTTTAPPIRAIGARMAYRFTIPAEVVHHPRPRVAKTGAFMPEKYRRWKSFAVMVLRGYPNDGWPIAPPVEVDIDFYFRRPKSRIRAYSKDLVLPRSAARGDLDNAVKSVLDALQDAGIMANDSAVWAIRARQWYSRECDDPEIVIDVRHGQSGP